MPETELLKSIIKEVTKLDSEPNTKQLSAILRKYPKPEGGFFSKAEIIDTAKVLSLKTNNDSYNIVRKLLRMKPTRTISGVAPITIFTKPFDCPGNCIFCPNQTDMPKSYLREEPGAMRAEKLNFDPYEQTIQRIKALENIGHNTDKVDIIISGGTWSFYPLDYREWFIKQMFLALNQISDNKETIAQQTYSLTELQEMNKTAKYRCVGLTIETRPDYINEKEVIHLRKLGVTKVQLGIQSLDNNVLSKNQRGHTSEDSENAINLLRLAGFKIHIHWMANLYTSTIDKDYIDYCSLFTNTSIMPDELKIYPCSVVDNTQLKILLEKGLYEPYKEKDLIELLARCKVNTPRYCRITRVFRDIPSQLIISGTKKTNLRQLIHQYMKNNDMECKCIRCKEIRGKSFDIEKLKLNTQKYTTKVSQEFFLNYTSNNNLIGFLRLSLPNKNLSSKHFISELKNAAIIREVHIYGRSLEIGKQGETQHLGLGGKLIDFSGKIAIENGYNKLAVISAIGTKEYYYKKGFTNGKLYQINYLISKQTNNKK